MNEEIPQSTIFMNPNDYDFNLGNELFLKLDEQRVPMQKHKSTDCPKGYGYIFLNGSFFQRVNLEDLIDERG